MIWSDCVDTLNMFQGCKIVILLIRIRTLEHFYNYSLDTIWYLLICFLLCIMLIYIVFSNSVITNFSPSFHLTIRGFFCVCLFNILKFLLVYSWFSVLVSGVLSESVIQTSTLFPYRSLQSTEQSSLCHTIAIIIIVLSPLSLIQAFHIDICIRDLPMFINIFFLCSFKGKNSY